MGHGHFCPIKAWSFPLRQVTIPSSQPYLDVQKESRTFTRLSTSTALSHYVFSWLDFSWGMFFRRQKPSAKLFNRKPPFALSRNLHWIVSLSVPPGVPFSKGRPLSCGYQVDCITNIYKWNWRTLSGWNIVKRACSFSSVHHHISCVSFHIIALWNIMTVIVLQWIDL